MEAFALRCTEYTKFQILKSLRAERLDFQLPQCCFVIAISKEKLRSLENISRVL